MEDLETRYGKDTILFKSTSTLVKLLFVKECQSTPIQKYTKSRLFLYVFKGELKLSFGIMGKHVYIFPDQYWEIVKNEPFQITNNSETGALVVLAVQRGEVQEEPEIERFKQ